MFHVTACLPALKLNSAKRRDNNKDNPVDVAILGTYRTYQDDVLYYTLGLKCAGMIWNVIFGAGVQNFYCGNLVAT